MVLITIVYYSYWGESKPTCNWGGPHCNSNWLVVFRPTPLKNDGVTVSWDDEIPNIWDDEIPNIWKNQ